MNRPAIGELPEHWEGDGVQNGITEQTPVNFRRLFGSVASAAAILVIVLRAVL